MATESVIASCQDFWEVGTERSESFPSEQLSSSKRANQPRKDMQKWLDNTCELRLESDFLWEFCGSGECFDSLETRIFNRLFRFFNIYYGNVKKSIIFKLT